MLRRSTIITPNATHTAVRPNSTMEPTALNPSRKGSFPIAQYQGEILRSGSRASLGGATAWSMHPSKHRAGTPLPDVLQQRHRVRNNRFDVSAGAGNDRTAHPAVAPTPESAEWPHPKRTAPAQTGHPRPTADLDPPQPQLNQLKSPTNIPPTPPTPTPMAPSGDVWRRHAATPRTPTAPQGPK